MLKNYLKLAFKVLLRRKFYTFISVMCVAFTLMVLVFVTAVMQTSLNSKGVERNSNRYLIANNIYLRRMVNERAQISIRNTLGYAYIERYLLPMTSPEAIAYFTAGSEAVSYQNGARIESIVKRTNARFWKVFVFDFIEGRPYNQAEHDAGSSVAVISERTRARYFGGDSALGKKIFLQNTNYTVIGVVENVGYPEELAASDIWVPVFATNGTSFMQQDSGEFIAVLMGSSTADLSVIQEEFSTVAASFIPSNPMMTHGSAKLFTNEEAVARRLLRMIDLDDERDDTGPSIQWVLSALVAGGLLFMLLPAINLTNLNISRIMERAGEIGVRKSFGAPATALIGQFVLENTVLATIGGVVGFGLAWGATYLLAHSGIFPVSFSILTIDLRVFAIGLGTILIFSLLSGLYPAWKMSRLDPVKALRGTLS